MAEFILGKHRIGGDNPCFIIAEIGHNHQGKLELAKQMIDSAAASGAHAVKLQKRHNKTLFTKTAYDKPYENDNSFGATYGEHRERLEFNELQYKALKTYAESKGLIFFATPFDIRSVDFLERIDVSAYKIPSALITDIPLIEYAASKGKPLFISTGACDLRDIDRAYSTASQFNIPICLLHCVASYPMMDYRQANMNVITLLKETFPKAVIGFSSHESGIMLPIAAYVLGARVVEKHFTLNRAMKGTDQKFSLEPSGLEKLSRDLSRLHESLGEHSKQIQPCEIDAKTKLGKSIYAKELIKKGTVLTPDKVAFKSPGTGFPPYLINELLGRRAKLNIREDTQLDFNLFSSDQLKPKKRIDWSRYV